MSTKNETGVNLTQGRDKTFDDLVKKTNDYLKKEATRLVMVNNGSIKFFFKKESPDRKVPVVLEIRQHLNNSATVLLGLDAGDIVGVTRPHYYNMDEPVKFYASALYLECQANGEAPQQVYSTEGTVRTSGDNYTALDAMSSLASSSNRDFLKTFIGAALMTDYHHTAMMQIVVVNRMMSSTGSMFNSNVYQVREHKDGYRCEPHSLDQDFEEGYIYVRHHFVKNELQFYYTNKDKIHEILQWIESQSNGKFFIHHFVGRNKADPTIRYRVCPILPMI